MKTVKYKDQRRFKRLTKGLRDLLAEIREYCPEANYYLAMENLHLMVGDCHDELDKPRQDRIVCSETLGHPCGGGDW